MAYFSKRDWKTLLLILWLVSTPLIINSILGIQEGIVRDKEYIYNENALVNNYELRTNTYNGTWDAELINTYIFDNTSLSVIGTSLSFPIRTNPMQRIIMTTYNITAIGLDSGLYKIKIIYTYVGSGNLTSISLQIDSDTYTIYGTGITTIYTSGEIPENGTIILELEVFQSLKIVNAKGFRITFSFTDSQYLPNDGDYIEYSVHFYKKDTIVSKDTLIATIIGFLAIVNFTIAIAITKFWNPLSSRRRR